MASWTFMVISLTEMVVGKMRLRVGFSFLFTIVPTIILFQRAENARFLQKPSHLPRQRCTDRKQGLRGTVTYLNPLNKSINYQACAWVLPHAVGSD
jgi:hypothetical protein